MLSRTVSLWLGELGCLHRQHCPDHCRAVCAALMSTLQKVADKIERGWEGDPKKMKDLEQMPCREIPKKCMALKVS